MILPFKWNTTLFDNAWSKELFYAKYPANTEYKWCDTDLPENAIFQDDSITYKFNEYGFRSDSFSNRSEYNILVSGCSLTVGVGVPFDAVWFNRLKDKIQQQTGKTVTVWNLAQSAASPDYSVRSIYKTIDILKPDAVVILWPAESRFEFPVDVNSNKLQDFMLPDGDTGKQNYPMQLMNEQYFFHELRKNILFMEMLCAQHNAEFIHGPCHGTPVNVGPRDGARDKHHPDTIWHEEWASAVYEYWNLHCRK